MWRCGMWSVFASCLLSLGCGGGGGADGARSSPQDPWAPVAAQLEQFRVDDLAVVIGDAGGERWRYQKGRFSVTSAHLVASSSKWLTGGTLMALVEQGLMSLADRPQDYLGYWTNDSQDPRSQINLAMLLSFTAGFSVGSGDGSCVGNGAITVQDCAREFYDAGVDTAPGSTFYYGPAHMQVAVAMAEIATGQVFNEIVRLMLAEPLGLSAATTFPAPSRTRPARRRWCCQFGPGLRGVSRSSVGRAISRRFYRHLSDGSDRRAGDIWIPARCHNGQRHRLALWAGFLARVQSAELGRHLRCPAPGFQSRGIRLATLDRL